MRKGGWGDFWELHPHGNKSFWLRLGQLRAFYYWPFTAFWASLGARLYRAAAQTWEVAEPPPGYERNDMFVAEIKYFLEMLADRSPAAPSLADGIRSLALGLAILESARSGRRIDLTG